ncbi:MAG: peptidoglycan DD-metalloendopeptidase family protein [[Eubacterium] saphenum]|nr:peptidoglycan DD-metalloendopeptidase family protein [[Eubacterium] saphenum]
MGIYKKLKKPSFWARAGAAVCAAALLIIPSDNLMSKNASGSSSMQNIQDQISQIQKENEERKKQIEKLGSDIADNEEAMGVASDLIDGINAEITANGQLIIAKQESIDAKKLEIEAVEKTIAEKEDTIETKKSEIAEMQVENKRNLDKFAKLARALYMTDSSSTLPILNGSDDWYNYYVYSDVVKNISGQNLNFMKSLLASIEEQEKMIDDLNVEIDGLEQDKKNLQKQKEQLESEMDALEEEKTGLETYAGEQKSYLYGLAAQNESLKNKVDGLEYDIAVSNSKLDDLDKELQELIRQAQQNGTGSQGDYSSGFRWPLDPQFHRITTYYGYDPWRNGNHGGIDVVGSGVAVGNANIYTVQSGTVIKVSNTCPHDYSKYYSCGCGGGWGNYIVVDHGGGVSTLYAHCRKIFVYEGQQVTRGDVIGLVGCTGWSTGDHLHFEVRENGYRVDPFKYEYSDY